MEFVGVSSGKRTSLLLKKEQNNDLRQDCKVTYIPITVSFQHKSSNRIILIHTLYY